MQWAPHQWCFNTINHFLLLNPTGFVHPSLSPPIRWTPSMSIFKGHPESLDGLMRQSAPVSMVIGADCLLACAKRVHRIIGLSASGECTTNDFTNFTFDALLAAWLPSWRKVLTRYNEISFARPCESSSGSWRDLWTEHGSHCYNLGAQHTHTGFL